MSEIMGTKKAFMSLFKINETPKCSSTQKRNLIPETFWKIERNQWNVFLLMRCFQALVNIIKSIDTKTYKPV